MTYVIFNGLAHGVADHGREYIGELTVPTPNLDELAADLVAGFVFLGQLDVRERHVATVDGVDMALVLRMLAEIPDGRLAEGTCWWFNHDYGSLGMQPGCLEGGRASALRLVSEATHGYRRRRELTASVTATSGH